MISTLCYDPPSTPKQVASLQKIYTFHRSPFRYCIRSTKLFSVCWSLGIPNHSPSYVVALSVFLNLPPAFSCPCRRVQLRCRRRLSNTTSDVFMEGSCLANFRRGKPRNRHRGVPYDNANVVVAARYLELSWGRRLSCATFLVKHSGGCPTGVVTNETWTRERMSRSL